MSPSLMPRTLRVVGMDLEDVLGMPGAVVGAPRLRADVVVRENAAGRQDQREVAVGALVRRHEGRQHEAALAAHELVRRA